MSPSVILVDAAAAESFLATFGRIQFVDWLELHVRVWEENDLRYPVSLMHFKRMFTHVSEDYADFATIIGIDYSGRVHHGDVVFQRQSRTWADQSDISGWNSQSHARMHERLTARADDRVLIASEVCSTIVRVSVTDVIGFAADMHLVSELFENEYAYDADNPSDYQDDCDTGQCEQRYPYGCEHPYPRVWELAPDFQECQHAGQQ